MTKNLQNKSKKSNLSFGFENTFRRRKRELGTKAKPGKGKKESNKSEIIKGQNLENVPNSSYLNTFAKEKNHKEKNELAMSIKDTMNINTNHRFGISSIQDQGKIK